MRPTAIVHYGDALDVLASIESETIDAIVTDPPYCSGGATEASRGRAKGQGLRKGHGRFAWFDGDNMTSAGLVFLLRSIAFECVRIVKPSGSMLVFCDWRMAPILGPAIESAGWRLRNIVVWDKGSMGLGTGFRPSHEMILHLTARAPEFYAANVGNVIRSKRIGTEHRDHPTEKPIWLMEDLVRVVAPAGGTVLDPFAGSGATLRAAINLGINAIGVERDPEYVEIARERCRL